MYFDGLMGLKKPLYAIHKYVVAAKRNPMSAIPQSNIPQSLRDPAFTTSGKPFVSTNRTISASEEFFNSQIDDPVVRSLEGTPKEKRGSRSKPSVMKYPIDLGNAEVPHVMQFKIFWRWENKDIAEGLRGMKMESQKRIGNLNTLSSLIDGGDLTEDMLLKSPLSGEQIAAFNELVSDTNYSKLVDPNVNDNMATLLQNNPGKAKQIFEQTIITEQNRISSIESELSSGAGKVGLDETERLQVQDRISSSLAGAEFVSTDTQQSPPYGTAALLALTGQAAASQLALTTGTAVSAAPALKVFTNEPVYDQMVSIYLPFCTKVNNEDSFVYEDSSQMLAAGGIDFLNSPIDTSAQAIRALIQSSVDKILPGTVGVGTGKVVNPRLEKLFKQKDFRNFSFSWEFYPRNPKEVQEIKNIIETFRYHSHPARDEEVIGANESDVLIVLRVPAEFEVRFLSSNPNVDQAGFVENEYLPRIGRCALTSVSVDYTPNSIFSTFVDNSPTAITMTLNFSEMGVLTRDTVEKGY